MNAGLQISGSRPTSYSPAFREVAITWGQPSLVQHSLGSLGCQTSTQFYVKEGAAPTLGDMNSDGKLDLIVGVPDGTLRWFKNTAMRSNVPAFTQLACISNPLNGIDVGSGAKPAVGDMDGDGVVLSPEQGRREKQKEEAPPHATNVAAQRPEIRRVGPRCPRRVREEGVLQPTPRPGGRRRLLGG